MVKWTDQARQDLRQIHAFIARDSLHYAKKVSQDIVEKTTLLYDLPRMGRVVPEVGDENVRELSLYSYRIIYEISEPDVYILAVIHKRRNVSADDIKRG